VSGGSLAIEVLFNGVFWPWLLGLVPAAVVTLLKGRLALFCVGWLTLGLTWFVGALSLADPGSAWARRFYGEERLARAADPERHPLPGRTAALWVAGIVSLFLVVGLLASRPTPVTGVDGTALQYSVGGSFLDSSAQPCQRRARGWTCGVYDSDVSGDVPYRVKMHRLGCWTATRIGSFGDPSERRLTGCVTIWDEIRLFNAIL
jgi:hypothetical protein